MLSSGEVVRAARLVVFAVALSRQGTTLSDGSRLSTVAFASLIRDAVIAHRTELVTAYVALGNDRSLALCRRAGLTGQSLAGRYARVLGRFATAPEA